MHETEEAAINTKVIAGEENCFIELDNLKSKATGDNYASTSYNVCISDTKSTVINSDPDYDYATEEGSREDMNRSDEFEKEEDISKFRVTESNEKATVNSVDAMSNSSEKNCISFPINQSIAIDAGTIHSILP